MSEYVYKSPVEDGYKEFTIKWKNFVEIVPTRKGIRFTKVKGYIKGEHIVVHYIPTLTGCLLTTLLFPVGLLLDGVSNWKDTWHTCVTHQWKCEESGKFISDDFYKKRGETFDKLLRVAKFKGKTYE